MNSRKEEKQNNGSFLTATDEIVQIDQLQIAFSSPFPL